MNPILKCIVLIYKKMHQVRYPSGCVRQDCEVCNKNQSVNFHNYSISHIQKLDEYGDMKIDKWQVLDFDKTLIAEFDIEKEAKKFINEN